jgi:hypothetical protein
MTNKELYREFCTTSPQLPIFMQDWWLDAVCAGKQWDVLLVRDADQRIVCAMPYLIRKRAWVNYIVMPQMTQISGPWISDEVRINPDELSRVIQDLVNQLQQLDIAYYYQHLNMDEPMAQVYKQLGFRVKERITYRINNLSNLDAVINAFSKNKKRQLQKALSLHADMNLHVEDFYRFHVSCLQERGKQISYTREFLLVLERKTKRLQQSQVVAIRNADGALMAAAFVVWDQYSMYYLIPAYSEAYKDSGASALLVLECIKLAREKGVIFDFEGSMIRGVANHYKQFGSAAEKYYGVERYYKWWFWFANAYNWVKERKMR